MCILPNYAEHDLKKGAPRRKDVKKAKPQKLKMIVTDSPLLEI
jgi:hypothetical protein